jgi:hypothetical protein
MFTSFIPQIMATFVAHTNVVTTLWNHFPDRNWWMLGNFNAMKIFLTDGKWLYVGSLLNCFKVIQEIPKIEQLLDFGIIFWLEHINPQKFYKK